MVVCGWMGCLVVLQGPCWDGSHHKEYKVHEIQGATRFGQRAIRFISGSFSVAPHQLAFYVMCLCTIVTRLGSTCMPMS